MVSLFMSHTDQYIQKNTICVLFFICTYVTNKNQYYCVLWVWIKQFCFLIYVVYVYYDMFYSYSTPVLFCNVLQHSTIVFALSFVVMTFSLYYYVCCVIVHCDTSCMSYLTFSYSCVCFVLWFSITIQYTN